MRQGRKNRIVPVMLFCGAILLCLFSCGWPAGDSNGDSHFKIGRLDTAKGVRYPVTAATYIFETAFFRGTKEVLDKTGVEFFPVEIGKIHIESGKVIATGMTV